VSRSYNLVNEMTVIDLKETKPSRKFLVLNNSLFWYFSLKMQSLPHFTIIVVQEFSNAKPNSSSLVDARWAFPFKK
jgi:hypothetical protein